MFEILRASQPLSELFKVLFPYDIVASGRPSLDFSPTNLLTVSSLLRSPYK
jgi:hypothetical protein